LPTTRRKRSCRRYGTRRASSGQRDCRTMDVSSSGTIVNVRPPERQYGTADPLLQPWSGDRPPLRIVLHAPLESVGQSSGDLPDQPIRHGTPIDPTVPDSAAAIAVGHATAPSPKTKSPDEPGF